MIRLLFFKDFSDFSLLQTMGDREAIAEVWRKAYEDSYHDDKKERWRHSENVLEIGRTEFY